MAPFAFGPGGKPLYFGTLLEPDKDETVAREPIFNAPPAVGRVIVVLGAIFLVQSLVPPDWQRMIIEWGAFNPARYSDTSVYVTLSNGARIKLDQALPGAPLTAVTSFLTYGLLHSSFLHLGFNLIWLLAFGTPVARYLGEVRFYAFMMTASIAGAVVYYLFNIESFGNMIGASGAVSGLMGAGIRILFAPVHMVFRDGRLVGANRQGLAPFNDKRLVGFAAVWVGLNIVFGLLSQSGATAIAWEAHLGGFAFGLFGFSLFLPRHR